jgi:NADPH-dependent curcumin reductase CurA
MMAGMHNRQVIIASLPAGALAASDFELRDGPVPEPGPGEVRCRTLAITMGAGQRAGLQGSASYAGAPTTGVVMGGTGVARVEGSNDPTFRDGDIVVAPTGWQELSVHPGRALQHVDDDGDPALHLGVLGTNGLTAYFGLLDVGRPAAGETVVVSAASGSVGHLVGQIATLHGCHVIGVAGSDEKCALLTDRLGFDAAVNHRGDGFRDAFRSAVRSSPRGGIDVYFDNTGGDILGAALRAMRPHGRIVCCGVVSQYDTNDPAPGPRGIPGLLVNNRVRMEGFLVFDYADRYAEARAEMRSWIADGRLQPLVDEVRGIEHAAEAFVDLLAGGNVGTRIVRFDA